MWDEYDGGGCSGIQERRIVALFVAEEYGIARPVVASRLLCSFESFPIRCTSTGGILLASSSCSVPSFAGARSEAIGCVGLSVLPIPTRNGYKSSLIIAVGSGVKLIGPFLRRRLQIHIKIAAIPRVMKPRIEKTGAITTGFWKNLKLMGLFVSLV